jgi:anti-anti-sigma regulatory factor
MLKITPHESSSDGHSCFVLAGSIAGPWVGELRRLCEESLAAGSALTLDLSQVSFLDSGGVDLCRSLIDRKVVILGCSRFVAEQLRQ